MKVSTSFLTTQRPSSITINFDFFLKLFLCLSPIIWLPGLKQNTLQFLVLDYGALILFGAALTYGQRRSCNNPAIFLTFLFASLISVINHPNSYPVAFIPMVAGVLLYYSIATATIDAKSIIKALLFVFLLNMGIAFWQKYFMYIIYVKPDFENLPYDVAKVDHLHLSMPGLMGRNYHLGYVATIITPLLFLLSSVWGWIGVILTLVYLLHIKSMILLLSFALSMTVMTFMKISKGLRFPLAAAMAGLVFFGCMLFQQDSMIGSIQNKISVRMPSYKFMIDEILVNPFVGRGIGTFDLHIKLFEDMPLLQSSFNQYLRTMYEVGFFPCLIIGLATLLYFLRFKLKNAYITASLISLFLYPMFHEVLRFARLAVVIIAVLALYEIHCTNNQNGRLGNGKEN